MHEHSSNHLPLDVPLYPHLACLQILGLKCDQFNGGDGPG